MIEQLTPEARQRLSMLAGFDVQAASVLSIDGKARLEVIFQPCLSMVMAVPAGSVDQLMADGKVRAFIDEGVPVILAYELASDAHRVEGLMAGGGSA